MIAAFGLPQESAPGTLSVFGMKVTGAHLTLLRADGSGKAEVERNKLFVGPSSGLPIVLTPVNDLAGLAITEGIEDALSVADRGAWAAGAAGRMPALAPVLPSYVECLTICAHPDPDGRKNALVLAEAAETRGIEVIVQGLEP